MLNIHDDIDLNYECGKSFSKGFASGVGLSLGLVLGFIILLLWLF